MTITGLLRQVNFDRVLLREDYSGYPRCVSLYTQIIQSRSDSH
jgi:hypothetical protein